MKTLQIIFVLGLLTLLGIMNVASAEMRNEFSQQALTFDINAGDDSVSMPDVSFDAIGSESGENAQATCVMTPGGNMQGELLQEPLTTATPVQWTNNTAPDVAFRPISSLDTPPPYNNPGNYPGDDPPVDLTTIIPEDDPDPDPAPDPDPSIVPEPATLLLVGLGLGAVACASRRRKET